VVFDRHLYSADCVLDHGQSMNSSPFSNNVYIGGDPEFIFEKTAGDKNGARLFVTRTDEPQVCYPI
jgi:hypothetical protein